MYSHCWRYLKREREREKLPDSGARFCSTRLARPSTWLFRIAEEGVLQVGALADRQQDQHTEKWRKIKTNGLCPYFEKMLKSKKVRLSILKADKKIALHISRLARFLAWPGCHVDSRYVKRASSPDITFQWCGLHWAMHTKGIIAPLLWKQSEISKSSPEPLA